MSALVEFILPAPEYEQIAWVHNEHFTASIAPLELSLHALNPRTRPDGLPDQIYINGYGFGRENNIHAPAEVPDEAIVAGWRERRLPAVEDVCRELETFNPESVSPGAWREILQSQEHRFWEVFGGVHRDTMGQVFPAAALWVESYVERFGEDRRLEAVAMLGGFPNASSERATALWDLGRSAGGHPVILAAISAGRLPDPDSQAARTFINAFAELLRRFGYTTAMHLMDLPTWHEDARMPLAMIAVMAGESEDRDPRRAELAAVARRQALEVTLVRLDVDDEQVAQLRRVLRVARYLTPASEDHNLLCDQRMIAAARVRWLRVGAQLKVHGLLSETDDVFYLSFDELIDALENATPVNPDLMAQRRAEQARWRSVSPPSRLGAQSADSGEPRLLRGVAASPGVYRGRARVITSLDQAGRLEPGDVLVCPATSPEWTPYFGVVGALVTGTGSLLAHAAVVAREFGIPAVVGAVGATSVISEGAMIEVDGSNGIVRIDD